jgi:hypothetical protein
MIATFFFGRFDGAPRWLAAAILQGTWALP